jgi:hypothetical protein
MKKRSKNKVVNLLDQKVAGLVQKELVSASAWYQTEDLGLTHYAVARFLVQHWALPLPLPLGTDRGRVFLRSISFMTNEVVPAMQALFKAKLEENAAFETEVLERIRARDARVTTYSAERKRYTKTALESMVGRKVALGQAVLLWTGNENDRFQVFPVGTEGEVAVRSYPAFEGYPASRVFVLFLGEELSTPELGNADSPYLIPGP